MPYTFEGNVELQQILLELGFESTSRGLQYDFGNCKLTASNIWSLKGNCYSFYVYYRSERKMGGIEFDLPLKVESYQQGVALLAYHLISADLLTIPEWLNNGKEWLDLLPWRRDLKAYEENPKAIIEHEWFRLLVKKIRTEVKDSSDDNVTIFSFDGTILKVECNDKIFVCSGTGKAWKENAIIKTKALDFLSKRIEKKNVFIYKWEGLLHIGNRGFNLAYK